MEDSYAKLERKLDRKDDALKSAKHKIDELEDQLDDTTDALKTAQDQLRTSGFTPATPDDRTLPDDENHHHHQQQHQDDHSQHKDSPDTQADAVGRGDYCDTPGEQKPARRGGLLTCKTPRNGGHLRWLY
ncbi:hypothetical protein CRD60_03180 [Bifidobacterium aemilianum]|uniref:Uncharacterized protein n=1 Tax=Bifidobacterium aemilianum TaxID=2493120 RepID=A0A366KAA3_9BIFI|nr:hypothetical protein [Bifidobacterium aemilianum]RBP98162.1 hypothetical protein CRD60_03180 [Bifidobacterium aemilianum]